MFRKTLVVLLFLVATARCCDRRPLMKIDAFVYSPFRVNRELHSVKLFNLEPYYRIEVKNATIPELCEEAVVDLPVLQTLSLNYLGIEEVHRGAFKNLPRLRHLALSLNNITHIKEGVFNNLNLVSLYLSANRIEKIDSSAFDDMPYLTRLNLDRNRIYQLDGRWFRNSHMIKNLDFTFNRLSEIPQNAFKNLQPHHEESVRIKLNNNKISKIHRRALRGGENYLRLQLVHNRIERFPMELYESLNHIQELDLRANKIECVSDDVLMAFTNNENEFRLNLQDNPIICECLERFDLLLQRHRNVAYSSTFNCFRFNILQ